MIDRGPRENSYQCDLRHCTARFESLRQLVLHKRRIHQICESRHLVSCLYRPHWSCVYTKVGAKL